MRSVMDILGAGCEGLVSHRVFNSYLFFFFLNLIFIFGFERFRLI